MEVTKMQRIILSLLMGLTVSFFTTITLKPRPVQSQAEKRLIQAAFSHPGFLDNLHGGSILGQVDPPEPYPAPAAAISLVSLILVAALVVGFIIIACLLYQFRRRR